VSVRKIIHLDLDAFFCAVEEQRDPTLRGVAFAVGGRPESRGVVASCSYAARSFGIRSAMPMAQAVRRYPKLRIVPGHYTAYRQASQQVMIRIYEITTQVEQISIDEAFLDVSELAESGESIARHLQSKIISELDLPCSLGVATNKLVAKIATDIGKAVSAKTGDPPNAIQVVLPGQEAAFLAPLPVENMWGIGKKTAASLAEMGIITIGELAQISEMDLIQRFGKHGFELARHARGIDDQPIITQHVIKSISQETTFPKDIQEREILLKTIHDLSTQVSHRLKKKHFEGTTVKLKLRWADFITLTRQTTLAQPTDGAEILAKSAQQLFENIWQPGRSVRLLGVGVSGLLPYQYRLWDKADDSPELEKEQRLQVALDQLHQRFGDHIIRLGEDASSNTLPGQKMSPYKNRGINKE
jgi:DNA polymerase-4